MIDCMMTTVQARVDDQLKRQADLVFRSIGLDASTAIRMFLAAVVNEGGLPFRARARFAVIDGEVLDVTEAELRHAFDDARLGRDLHGPFGTVGEMMSALEGYQDA